MKIVVLDGYSLNPGDLSWDALSKLGELTVYDRTAPDDIVSRAKGADILLTNKTRLKAVHFEALEGLKYVGVLATGYNIVDILAAKAHGIVVTNVPTYGTDAVAQYVFALLLEICHQVKHHSDSVKKGKWNSHEDFCFWDHPLIELSGKTMGIIGLGRIGLKTAEIAKAFGMKVIGYSPNSSAEGIESVSLESLYQRADVISLHCPLNEATRGMVDERAFSAMKQGVILINTARGPLIDEEALQKALDTGKVYGAGLDVLAVEPPKGPHPLFDYPNVILTPHIAWAPKEARARLLEIATENVSAFIENNPIHQVNP